MLELQPHLKAKLRRLRLEDGLSIKAIVAATKISTGTVSKYCKGLRQNNNPVSTQHLATAAFAKKQRERRERLIEEAKQQWRSIKNNPTILALVAFYWAEGSKRTNHKCGQFVFTNSDPGAIKAVSDVLISMGHKGQRLCLRLMPEHDIKKCQKAWENAVGQKVNSTTITKRRGNSNKIWSKHGVCALHADSSSGLWLAVTTWIACWRADLNIDESWQN